MTTGSSKIDFSLGPVLCGSAASGVLQRLSPLVVAGHEMAVKWEVPRASSDMFSVAKDAWWAGGWDK